MGELASIADHRRYRDWHPSRNAEPVLVSGTNALALDLSVNDDFEEGEEFISQFRKPNKRGWEGDTDAGKVISLFGRQEDIDPPLFFSQSEGSILTTKVEDTDIYDSSDESESLLSDSADIFVGSPEVVVPHFEIIPQVQKQDDPFLVRLDSAQHEFARAIGKDHSTIDWNARNYNPVADRVHLELLREAGDIAGEERLIKEIWKNMETSLSERLKVAESRYNYHITGEQVYSENFSKKPFIDVLWDGYNYRKENGSNELLVEGPDGDIGGWEKVCNWANRCVSWSKDKRMRQHMAEPKKRMYSFSPPGNLGDPTIETAYNYYFIDKFEFVDDPVSPYISCTRMSVDLDEKGYKQQAEEINPHFLEGFDMEDKRDGKLPAWYRSHPQETDKELHVPLQGMSLEDFQKIYSGQFGDGVARNSVQDFIRHYISVLQSGTIDWEKLRISFQAILNKIDREKEVFMKFKSGESISAEEQYVSVEEESNELGQQDVKDVEGFGCPTSSGFNRETMNSVAQFGMAAVEYTGGNAINDPSLCKCRAVEGPHTHHECGYALKIGVGQTICAGCGKGATCAEPKEQKETEERKETNEESNEN